MERKTSISIKQICRATSSGAMSKISVCGEWSGVERSAQKERKRKQEMTGGGGRMTGGPRDGLQMLRGMMGSGGVGFTALNPTSFKVVT